MRARQGKNLSSARGQFFAVFYGFRPLQRKVERYDKFTIMAVVRGIDHLFGLCNRLDIAFERLLPRLSAAALMRMLWLSRVVVVHLQHCSRGG